MQEQPQQLDELPRAIAPAPAEPRVDDDAASGVGLLVSQAEYARHRGVTRQAIGKLVAAEKIPIHLGARGEIQIDVAEADLALGENVERIDEPREVEAPTPDTRTLTRHRAATEEYRAKMARLVYEQRLDKALPVDQVEEAGTGFGGECMRMLRTLPTFAEELTAAAQSGGVAGVRMALRGIERTLLTRMGAAVEDMVKTATAASAKADDDNAIDELADEAAA
jgi:hypothetical protein